MKNTTFNGKTFCFIPLYVLFLSLSILSIPTLGNGQTYYISPAGDDSFNGLSPAIDGNGTGPWKTIDKVNLVSFAPGSFILFERGKVFEGRIYVSASGTAVAPITYGAYGTGDKPIIDGSDTISITWVTAPEVGSNVWKTSSIGYEPRYMYLFTGGEYKTVPGIDDIWMDGSTNRFDMTGFDALSQAADAKFTTRYLGMEIDFWDGLDALYGSTGGYTYIRFRDGSNPNSLDLRPSPSDKTFHFDDENYITVENLKMYGSRYNILIGGNYNIVDNCDLVGGQKKVLLEERNGNNPSNNTVKNSTMTPNFLSDYDPGPWGSGTEYVHGIREHIYNQSKYLTNTSSSDDIAIELNTSGSNNVFHDNTIHNGLVGLTGGSGDVADPCVASNFHHNTVYNMSSVGVTLYPGNKDQLIHDNLIYFCNINIRPHRLDTLGDTQRSQYIYNNRMYNPEGVGEQMFWHFLGNPTAPAPHIYFYHNSMAGGVQVLEVGSEAVDNYGLSNTIFVNNIISSKVLVQTVAEFIQDASMIEVFDYSWVGGFYYYHGEPAWFGDHLIETGGYSSSASYPYFWPLASMPDWSVTGTAAEEAGIDVSRRFTVNGTTYDALPGMEPGYFPGDVPDLGVVGFEEEIPRLQVPASFKYE